MKEYRIVEGIGPYWNKRWELQEKYSYCEWVGNKIERIFSWHTVCHGTKEFCEEALKRRAAYV